MGSNGYVAPMNVIVNGEPQDFDDDELTIAELLIRLNLMQPAGIAVALNLAVVPRSRWGVEQVSDGDAVEIVRATQGG